jgi:hypothetical protein
MTVIISLATAAAAVLTFDGRRVLRPAVLNIPV